MTTVSTSISASDLQKSFPTDGRPNRLDGKLQPHHVLAILKYLAVCAQTVESTFAQNGLLYILIPPSLWQYFSELPYPLQDGSVPFPDKPDAVPDYSAAVDDNDRARIKAEHANEEKEYLTARAANTALVNTLCELLGSNAKIIRTEAQKAPAKKIMDLLLHLATKCPTHPTDSEANLQRMMEPWNHTTGMDPLIEQIEAGVLYGEVLQEPIEPWRVVNTAQLLIQNTGVYPEEMKQWLGLPKEQRTWENMKTFWDTKMQTATVATGTTPVSAGYMNNTVEEEANVPDSVVKDFVEASVAKDASYVALAEQNSALTAAVAQQQQFMMSMMQQQQMQQQMQQQQLAGNYGGQQGGRRRNSRKPNKQAPGPGGYVMPMQMPNMQMMCPPAHQQMQPMGRPPNKVKRYQNMNFCWSHGHDVQPGHTSQTCTNPAQGHNYFATRENPMGGSMKGSHKTIMPNAVGKECASKRGQRQQQQQQQQVQWKQPTYQQPMTMANNMMGMMPPMQQMPMQQPNMQQQPMMMQMPMQQAYMGQQPYH